MPASYLSEAGGGIDLVSRTPEPADLTTAPQPQSLQNGQDLDQQNYERRYGKCSLWDKQRHRGGKSEVWFRSLTRWEHGL